MTYLAYFINDLITNARHLSNASRTRKKINITPSSGFTIVELLIVIVIIAVLAAIVVVAYNGITNRSHDAAVRNDLAAAAKSAEMFKIDSNNGRYPIGSTDLNTMYSDGKYRLKATKDSYKEGVNNYLFCVNDGTHTTPLGSSFAIVARSESGKAFYAMSSGGSVKELTTAFTSGSQTTCGAISPQLDNAAPWGYAGGTGVWSAWVGE